MKLVTALQRLERLAQQDGRRHLSPHETLLLQAQITGLRKNIPSDVLNSYETVKRSDPKAFRDPQLFPLVVLLAVITVWAGQKLRFQISKTTQVAWPFASGASSGRVSTRTSNELLLIAVRVWWRDSVADA